MEELLDLDDLVVSGADGGVELFSVFVIGFDHAVLLGLSKGLDCILVSSGGLIGELDVSIEQFLLGVPGCHLVGDLQSKVDEGVIAELGVQGILSLDSGAGGIVVGDLGCGIKIEEGVGLIGLGDNGLGLGSELSSEISD